MFFLLAAMIPKAFSCFQTESENELHLWQCRNGNLSCKGLRTLFYNGKRAAFTQGSNEAMH